jgi:RNA polymerase sigma factor (sigma-70 family)
VARGAALLTADEETRIARQLRAGDPAARDLLAARNHDLVFELSRALTRRLPPGMERADLIQEGFLGLYRAAQLFDPELGHRFSTYATWAVRSHMLRAMLRWRHSVRLPPQQEQAWGRVLAARARAAAEGRELTLAELASAAGCSPPTVCALLAVATPPVRLDHPWEDEDGAPGRCRELPCPRAPSEAAIVARLQLEAAVARLPERWQRYIRLRFGLEGGEPCTQVEVARLLGCHRITACRMEQAALARLKQLMEPRRRRPQAGG